MHIIAISAWAVALAVISRPCVVAVVPLDSTGWTITADSFQAGYEPTKALDKQTTTAWRTKYVSSATPYPHWLIVNMKIAKAVAGIDYLPRQATTTTNGNIGKYQVALSADGKTWGTAVANGTWNGTSSVKQVRFAAATGSYLRLLALSEYRVGNPWANAAEVTVYGTRTLLWTVQAGLPQLPSV